MTLEERGTLSALLSAMEAVTIGLSETRDLMRAKPAMASEMGAFDIVQRAAARGFLKAFEQLQDIVAKVIRVILILEDEDLTGLSARGMADRAEGIGIIGSADRWSALVRLRNRLVHEYPLTLDRQFDRLAEVWEAQFALLAVTATIHEYLRDHDYPEADHD